MSISTPELTSTNDLNESEVNTEDLDPRIQEELEKLNKSCDDINKLENELEEARTIFSNSKNHYVSHLNDLEKTIGSSIGKARPYFEALKSTKILQDSALQATHDFRQANSLYQSAKETLDVAESNLNNLTEISAEWQEHMSEIILKMNINKKESDRHEKVYHTRSAEYQRAELELDKMENKLQRHIVKAAIYFQESDEWNSQVERHQQRLCQLETKINEKKNEYREAMKKLSLISEEIHNKRKVDLEI